MTTEIGKRYRDRITGVIGAAMAQMVDESPVTAGGKTAMARTPMTQLKLDPIHIEDHPDADLDSAEYKAAPKAFDRRWYDDERLETVDA